MGSTAEDEQPESPPLTEVEITVGGHTIVVKAAAPMEDVASQALGLYESTKLPAETIRFGFQATSSQIELAPQPDLTHRMVEPDGPDEEGHARLGRIRSEKPPA